jgi:hypothetical protein
MAPPTQACPSPIRGMMPTVQLYDHYARRGRVGWLSVIETGSRKAKGPCHFEVCQCGTGKGIPTEAARDYQAGIDHVVPTGLWGRRGNYREVTDHGATRSCDLPCS